MSVGDSGKRDDQEFRWMAAMWADTVRHQLARFEHAVDVLTTAQADYGLRAAFRRAGRPPEWADEIREADGWLTQHQLWDVGAQRYFLLLALAQLRKCVRRLEADDLPALGEDKLLRLLRDIDEHWEQLERSRSLNELANWKPHLKPGPGQLQWSGKHVWLGDVSLAEIWRWVEDVEAAVRVRAETSGLRISKPGDRLPDSDASAGGSAEQ